MGRRRIEIAKVKDQNTRQVTFSKRRTGLFKKANELSILCGVKIAIVVFSPGNKPYSFGHPAVDVVAEQFLRQQTNGESNKVRSEVRNLKKIDKLTHLMKMFDEEQKKSAMLDVAINKRTGTQLAQYENENSHDSLLELKLQVENDIECAETLILFSREAV